MAMTDAEKEAKILEIGELCSEISRTNQLLLDIFRAGGVSNPDLATLKSELQAYASNAGNISAGILATAHGGTGRSDGMVTDVYLTQLSASAINKGLLDNRLPSPTISSLAELREGRYLYSGAIRSLPDCPLVLDNGGVVEVQRSSIYTPRMAQICYGYSRGGIARRNSEDGGQTWSSWSYSSTGDHSRNNVAFIYVSKTGNDQATGSISNPLASVSRAISIACDMNYTIICVGPGEWGDLQISNTFGSLILTNWDNKAFEDTVSTEKPVFNSIVISGSPWVRIAHIDVVKNINVSNNTFVDVFNCSYSLIDVFTQSSVSISGISNLRKKYSDARNMHYRVVQNAFLQIIGTVNIPDNDDVGFMFTIGDYGTLHLLSSTSFVGTFNGFKLWCDRIAFITGISNEEEFNNIVPGNISTSSSAIFAWHTTPYIPYKSNTFSLGNANRVWTEVFANTGTINTSDERFKINISFIPDKVLDAWEEVNFAQFQFTDAIEKKGTNARLHTGIIVQRIMEIFQRHNLDPFRYGAICYDEWQAKDWDEQVEETPERVEYTKVIDVQATADMAEQYHMEEKRIPATYKTVHHHEDGGNRYSLRYEEALCINAACDKRKIARLEARLAALEAKV